MQPPTRWVYEWEDSHFYNMLLQQWQTTAAWTGQTWQDYKAELLRVQGLNVMSTAEYQMATQMGGLPISTALIFYYYDYGIVCTIITITMVLYARLYYHYGIVCTIITVGELGKNLSPSKRRSYQIRKYIHELASGWKVLFREKETLMKRS
jgi:hypothetical protein